MVKPVPGASKLRVSLAQGAAAQKAASKRKANAKEDSDEAISDENLSQDDETEDDANDTGDDWDAQGDKHSKKTTSTYAIQLTQNASEEPCRQRSSVR